MSFFLPLLLAGALAGPAVSTNVSLDDKNPRARRVLIDTTEHRQLAAELVLRAKTAAENGSLQEARAQLLTANTMYRESGGLDKVAAYSLVHIDYALDRYIEAGDVLDELSEQALEKGDATLAATAAVDAAELYSLGGRSKQVGIAVVRARQLLTDSRISNADRAALKKRIG